MSFTLTANWGQPFLSGTVTIIPSPTGTIVNAQITAGVLTYLGSAGVPLLASATSYLITFSQISFNGNQATITPIDIPSFADTTTQNLIGMSSDGLAPVTPFPVMPATYDSSITLHADSATAIGVELLTAPNAAAALAALGVGSSISSGTVNQYFRGDQTWQTYDEGAVELDSFTGTDDQKLAAAMTYAAAQTHIPAIRFPAREVTLNTGGLTPYSGMKLIGPSGAVGSKNLEIGSNGVCVNHRVHVTTGVETAALFNSQATVFDVHIFDLAFQDDEGVSQFWYQAPGTTLWSSEWHGLTFYGFKHIIGSPAQAAPVDGLVFSGYWQAVAAVDTQFNLAGSDNSLWRDGLLNLGSARSAGPGVYLMMLDLLGKTDIGYIYITVDPGWKALLLAGNSTSGGANFFGGTYEGDVHNGTYPTTSIIDITGGNWNFYGTRMNYVTTGATGVVTQSGGTAHFHDVSYQRASAVTASLPLLYQTGGIASFDGATALQAGESINVRWTDTTVVTLPLANENQLARSLVPAASLTYNLGSFSSYWNNIFGSTFYTGPTGLQMYDPAFDNKLNLITPALSTATTVTLPATSGTLATLGPNLLTGNYYFCNGQSVTSTATFTQSDVRTTPWLVPDAITVTAVFAEFTAAGDINSIFHIGIWNDNGSGQAGTLLQDCGSISTGTSNSGTVSTGGTPGTYAITSLSIAMAPGLYWVGGAFQTSNGTPASPTMRVPTSAIGTVPIALGASLPSAGATFVGWHQTGITGAFGTFTPSASGNAGARIGFKC